MPQESNESTETPGESRKFRRVTFLSLKLQTLSYHIIIIIEHIINIHHETVTAVYYYTRASCVASPPLVSRSAWPRETN